jgi:hypothetical protein
VLLIDGRPVPVPAGGAVAGTAGGAATTIVLANQPLTCDALDRRWQHLPKGQVRVSLTVAPLRFERDREGTRPGGALRVRRAGHLAIKLGDTEELKIEGSLEALARVTTEVRGDRLTIAARGSVGEPDYLLTVKRLTAITVAGSGDVAAPDLQGEQVSLTLAGSGDLATGRIEAKSVQVRLVSSGDALIRGLKAESLDVVDMGSASLAVNEGEVGQQKIAIHGSGDYHAKNLSRARATATISGSGEMALWVREALSVTINGSGTVAYRGHPTLEQRINGSGEIQALGD